MDSLFFGSGSKGSPKNLTVCKSPDQQLARLNKVFVSEKEFSKDVKHVKIENKLYTLGTCSAITSGKIGLTMFQRKFAQVFIGQTVKVEPVDPSKELKCPYLACMSLKLSFLNRSLDTGETIDASDLSAYMISLYNGTLFSKGQSFNFDYMGMEILMEVVGLVLVNLDSTKDDDKIDDIDEEELASAKYGILNEKCIIEIFKAPNCQAHVINGAKFQFRPQSLLKKGFKFEDLGIGGLDKEFKQIFRRAFSSRIFPPDIINKLGIQHVKGLLLHGPPGTGKTLLARQIGKMLNSVEPIIVNGPEVLNKYVGESEQNVRKLFQPAEEEYKQKGEASRIHIIIFDELDAICKQRGSKADGTGVGDSIVNQLLSKMDGVNQLNNILIIGMTNRIDLIDAALLRPGRLEVHIEISLPDKEGRKQIFRVHTASMRKNEVIGNDVDIDELAELTKNYSGAEIEGLCKSAVSFSLNKHIKLGTTVTLGKKYEQVMVSREDFMVALDEIKPAYGVEDEDIDKCILNGIIEFSKQVDEIIKKGKDLINLSRVSSKTPITSHLLHGAPGSGKTALAAAIVQNCGFPFIKMVTPDKLVNMSEPAKVSEIVRTFNDAYKSELSIVVIDSIERILEWVSIGPRFSNALLQTILIYLKKIPDKSHRLHVLVTGTNKEVLERMDLLSAFDSVSAVQCVMNAEELRNVLYSLGSLEKSINDEISSTIANIFGGRELYAPIKDIILIYNMACLEKSHSSAIEVFVKNFIDKFGGNY